MALLPDKQQAAVAEVFGLYQARGHADYIGEPVSQLEHMWQAAALAEAAGADDEVVLAAFFHDLGHLCAPDEAADSMGGFGAVNHEKLGADYLRARGFSARVARLVESHVQAKRYLTYRYPSYRQQLSAASQATLAFQGGVMTAAEAEAFEQDPDMDQILQLRQWDEQAKEAQRPVGSLAHLQALALRHLLSQAPPAA
ncbi:HD domain-containing protein [Hymenobacter sp. UV11]|uniref:phosphonate degradation HD-domain oxygenase n=1 Tax=Hymenobacter sp. UV11 TaxID=1849735 RepID=UPI0010618638|nr:phosphonate degradation HD-domain oxygenase [Hymenobacter sp. UV11]TDN40579.1 phosphohydrolase [Hymenobacter sp. UV11]TFZ66404.1 HD domain-containing protein [Hymenobacter sp. UV11]